MLRAKLRKAALAHVLGGSVADVTKAAFAAAHDALQQLADGEAGRGGAAAPAAATGGGVAALPQKRQQPERSTQQRPHAALALVLGPLLVARCRDKEAAVAAAAAVRRVLGSLRVGRHPLEVPVAAHITAGPSLHHLAQALV